VKPEKRRHCKEGGNYSSIFLRLFFCHFQPSKIHKLAKFFPPHHSKHLTTLYLRSKRHRRHLFLPGPRNRRHLLREVGHELQVVVGMHPREHFDWSFVEVGRHFEFPVLGVEAEQSNPRKLKTIKRRRNRERQKRNNESTSFPPRHLRHQDGNNADPE